MRGSPALHRPGSRRCGLIISLRVKAYKVGAFGWIEDLRRNPAKSEKAHSTRSQGFIHTPSLTHAKTAAILRSGWNSYGSDKQVSPASGFDLSFRADALCPNGPSMRSAQVKIRATFLGVNLNARCAIPRARRCGFGRSGKRFWNWTRPKAILTCLWSTASILSDYGPTSAEN